MILSKVNKTIVAALLIFGYSTSFSQTCSSVYQESTRNIDAQSKIETEINKTYSDHCESNGSLKSSSAGLDLTIPIKKVKLSFSGTKEDAAQQMQEFCKTRKDFFASTSTLFAINNSVVVEALNSFNQCVLIETKGGVIMSHKATTSDVVIRGDFNPSNANVELQSVTYNATTGACINNSNGKKIVSGKPFKATGPFSITCNRTAQKTKEGDKYPRFEVLVATNHGTYPAIILADDVLNLDLASENKMQLAKLDLLRLKEATQYSVEKQKYETQITAETQKSAQLQARLDNIKITKTHDFTQGDGQVVPCAAPGNAPTLGAYIAGFCGADRPFLTEPALASSGGGYCGTTTRRLICLKTY